MLAAVVGIALELVQQVGIALAARRGKPAAGLPSPCAPWQLEQGATLAPPPCAASVAPALRCASLGAATCIGAMIGPEAAAVAADAALAGAAALAALAALLADGVPPGRLQPASDSAAATPSTAAIVEPRLMTRSAREPSGSD
jgi:hypothetical protein